MNEMPADIAAWVQHTITHWKSASIKLNRGASQAVIEAVEWHVGLVFPPEVKAFYQAVNGFAEDEWTGEMIAVWSMERIRQEYGSWHTRDFVGFCDYLINSHAIGFCKDRPGIYKSYDLFNPIAESFRQAIELINAGANEIY
jgi:hypothetical protein